MNHLDDEMFDDLHEGVEALREVAHSQSIPFSKKAVATLQRLESTVPFARTELRLWKQKLADGAVQAAHKTDEVVHEHPWLFTLSALGLGVLTGLVLSSSNCEEGNSPSNR